MSKEFNVRYEDILSIDPKIENDDMARKMMKSMLKGTSPYEASKTAVVGTKKSPETVYQKARRLYELIMKANGESLDDLLNQFKTGAPVYIPVLRVQAFKKLLVKEHLVHVDIEKVQKFTLLDDPIAPGPDIETGEVPFESETPGGPEEDPSAIKKPEYEFRYAVNAPETAEDPKVDEESKKTPTKKSKKTPTKKSKKTPTKKKM